LTKTLRVELGALDLCRVRDGVRHSEMIWETLELAPRLEAFGYSRYWVAEHHSEQVAHSSPEVLIPILAGVTDRIRVGAAGVLLRYHSPFMVAKSFRLLHAVFPGRIDLGLARGSVPELTRELLLGRGVEETTYEEKVAQLLEFLRGEGKTAANPLGVFPPEVWLLGSKKVSAALAAQNGTCFCFASFLGRGNDDCLEAINHYKEGFLNSTELAQPRWCVAVAGVCAESESRARELAGGNVGDNVRGLIVNVIGDPKHCRAMFLHMADMYSTNQFVFLDICPTFEARVNSYRLLAESLDLTSQKALIAG
jgi:luciferase family oxidoreductase group 1